MILMAQHAFSDGWTSNPPTQQANAVYITAAQAPFVIHRYRSNLLKEEEILLCLYSISDNNSFLLFNRDPIDRMIAYLKSYFRPDQVEHSFSLGINTGMQARPTYSSLTHLYRCILLTIPFLNNIQSC